MKNDDLKVPREWFERLNNIFDTYANSQGKVKDDYLNIMLGYISSVKTIIKLYEKQI